EETGHYTRGTGSLQRESGMSEPASTEGSDQPDIPPPATSPSLGPSPVAGKGDQAAAGASPSPRRASSGSSLTEGERASSLPLPVREAPRGTEPPARHRLFPRTVLLLSLASFFNDVASELLLKIGIPFYLVGALGNVDGKK